MKSWIIFEGDTIFQDDLIDSILCGSNKVDNGNATASRGINICISEVVGIYTIAPEHH